ncbi:MAG: OsmC family protein [Desulfobacterales bacterium]|jgi:putative redox protein|nr:OsmC family protein [Desulfobacterales bacterium]
MPKTTVRWVSQMQFVGMDSNHHSVVLSGDETAAGVRPSEMLLVALGACSAVDVVEILKKKRRPPSMLEISVDGERDPDPPWPYRSIHVHYRLSGQGLKDKAVRDAVALSIEKYCSVAATVRATARITTSFEIVTDVRDTEGQTAGGLREGA